MIQISFCAHCGNPVHLAVPEGDDRPRHVCPACGLIHYQNPKMVVGCIPEWEGKTLLCRRAIAPRLGFWTLPAGYLENEETAADGARREAFEEAGVKMAETAPFGLYNLAFVSQVYLMFRGGIVGGAFAPGKESLSARLFSEEEIPWGELAFTVIEMTLRDYFADRRAGGFRFHMDDVGNPAL